ncbi:MAG TPA: ATP synthase subunit I [Terriglobia bacterium]|nr:ATP synthase subunit I [Terriglobia bacterium]
MQTESIQIPELARAEARLPRWMILCGFLALVVILLCRQFMMAIGFGLGAALGILNYYWLHEAVEALAKAGQNRVPKLLVAKLLIRYPLAFGLVFLFFKTEWLPPMSILAGLFVPVVGVLIEAIVQIGDGLVSR